ncbi:hypothetical protein chiPu_0015453 [Chiloscyllium punctatum]|uniref:Uncharacterized protein n=1 Tax=Chiloscyllium punctatum TaxID=137246 RepID=A0A401T2R8_CHIPU|nr:hypothetical protein [Chiloscyllium punctatum]
MWTSHGRCAGRTDCTSRQNNSLSQVEVESAFRQLYSSLCGNKEKVEQSALADDRFAPTTIKTEFPMCGPKVRQRPSVYSAWIGVQCVATAEGLVKTLAA